MALLTRISAILAICLVAFLFLAPKIVAGERYFLNDNEALLYKVINWWYHADPDEAAGVCGTVVRITGDTPPKVSHDRATKRTTLIFTDFADLVSVGGKMSLLGASEGTADGLESKLIEGATGYRLQVRLPNEGTNALEYEQLYPELEGTILGLRDGKVAFYTAADNLYNCPAKTTPPTVRLRLLRQGSRDAVATFILAEEER